MNVNFQSETSKCYKIVFSSYFVICIFPLHVGGKNKMQYALFKNFRPPLEKPEYAPANSKYNAHYLDFFELIT